MSVKLTQNTVATLKPKDKAYTVWDSVLKGFYVKVSPAGNKVFCVSYVRPGGQRNTRKIGDCSILSVSVARDKAKAFLASVTLGSDPDKEGANKFMTLQELIEKYYRPWFAANRKGGDAAIDVLKSCFAEFMDKRPAELSILDLEKWQRRRRDEKGVKFATLNRETTTLKAALNWAVKRGLITDNPLNGLRRLSEVDSMSKTRYSSEERGRLLVALNAREKEMREARQRTLTHSNRRYLNSLDKCAFVDYFKPMVLVALNTGMRRNALFSLRWEDIDFQAGTIFLRADAAKSKKHMIIPMNATVRETLSAWKEQEKKDSGLVFANPLTGKKFDNCNNSWKSLLKAAGIEKFRWHDMRHDFASRLVMNGVDLNTVRELLGHSDIKMTMRYAHLAPEKKRMAVDTLD